MKLSFRYIIVLLVLFFCFGKSFAQTYDTAIAILQPKFMPVKSGLGSGSNNFWIQDSSGYVQDSVTFPSTRNYRFDFLGHAWSYGSAQWPDVTIKIDGVTKATMHLASVPDSIWSAVFSVNSGKHQVRIAYTDPTSNGSNKVYMGLLYIFSSNTSIPVKYPAIVKRNLPTYGSGFLTTDDFASGHFRGFNRGNLIRNDHHTVTQKDFDDLHRWGANVVRVWALLRLSGTNYILQAKTKDSLIACINRAKKDNIYIQLTITDSSTTEGFWGNTTLKNNYINRIRDLVTLFKDSTEIASISWCNEPSATDHLGEWVKFSQDIASAIRKIDTNHVILMPAMVDNGSDDPYKITEPLPYNKATYEVHFYSPFQITHQGINASDNIRTEYPNSSASAYWNPGYFGAYGATQMLADTKIQAAKKFADRYNVPIFVGEFTCVDYAPNYSTAKWNLDAIKIYENWGWSWAIHGFRQYEPWDPEIPPGRWYGFTYTNAFPNVTGGLSTLDQYRTDTTQLMQTLIYYFGFNPNTTTTINIYYRDQDNDTWGKLTDTLMRTTQPAGYVTRSGDCNDTNAGINPSIPETCGNGIDEDCSGSDATCTIYYRDIDADTYGNSLDTILRTQPTPPAGYAVRGGDCNDNNANVNPGKAEICGNGVDENCDGLVDACIIYYHDIDSDGFGNTSDTVMRSTIAAPPAGYVTVRGDCDDNNANVNPSKSEICGNATDEDCDGTANACFIFYHDVDADTYGNDNDTIIRSSPVPPTNYVTVPGDCNDNDASINPGQTEICGNGVDEDCDGTLDNACNIFYQDSDNDGYGNVESSVFALTKPAGYVSNSTDCNDGNLNINPAASEICGNLIDDNCNGQIDENCSGVTNLTFSQTSFYARSEDKVVYVPVLLTVRQNSSIAVTFSTNNGSAISGTDYSARSGTLMFAPNEIIKVIGIPLVKQHGHLGVIKTFTVTLANANGATIMTPTVNIFISE